MRSRPTEAEWLATLTKSYGEAKATALVAALKKAHPEKSIRTLSYMCNGGLNSINIRNHVTRMASMKCDQKGAPVFTWYFTWQSPMLEDAGAWHTAELAFWAPLTRMESGFRRAITTTRAASLFGESTRTQPGSDTRHP